jgi:hypothetical protein
MKKKINETEKTTQDRNEEFNKDMELQKKESKRNPGNVKLVP